MGFALCEKASGQIVSWSRWDDPSQSPDFDPALYAVVVATECPDSRSKRWDGQSGLRNASAAEMRLYDDGQADIVVDLITCDDTDDPDNISIRALLKVIADNVGMPLDRVHTEFRRAYHQVREAGKGASDL